MDEGSYSVVLLVAVIFPALLLLLLLLLPLMLQCYCCFHLYSYYYYCYYPEGVLKFNRKRPTCFCLLATWACWKETGTAAQEAREGGCCWYCKSFCRIFTTV